MRSRRLRELFLVLLIVIVSSAARPALLTTSHIGQTSQLSFTSTQDYPSLSGLVQGTLILYNNTIVPGNYAVPNKIPVDVPTSVAYASKNNHIYVTTGLSLATGTSSNRVSILDGNTNTLITRLGVGGLPMGLAYDQTHDTVYIATLAETPTIIGVSDASLSIVANITMPVGSGVSGVAYNPAEDRVYVADYYHSLVYVIDPATKQVTSLAVAAGPTGIAYDPRDDRLYVNCVKSATISVLDGVSDTVLANVTLHSQATLSGLRGIPGAFQDIAYDPSNKLVYLVDPMGLGINPKVPPPLYGGGAVPLGPVVTFNPSADQVTGSAVLETWAASVAYNPTDNKVYAAIYAFPQGWAGTVTVIDGTTNNFEANVTVDLAPIGLAFNIENDRLYVACSRSDSVSIIDGAMDKLVETFRLQNYPFGVAYDPDNHMMFVADQGSVSATFYKDSISDSLLVVNTTSGHVQEISTGGIGPTEVAYDNYNKNIYVTNFFLGNVTVISGITNKLVAQVSTLQGAGPWGIAYDSNNHNIYVANQNSNTVSVIDTTSNTLVAEVDAGRYPLELAYDSRDNLIFVTHFSLERDEGSFVTAIDGTTNSVVANITMGQNAFALGILYDAKNNNLYVANGESNGLTVISGTTERVVATIQLNNVTYQNPYFPYGYHQFPQRLVYEPVHDVIFVTPWLAGDTSPYLSTVWVVDAVTNKPIGTFTAGSAPTCGAFDSDNGYVYLSNYESGTLSVVSADSLEDYSIKVTPSSVTLPADSSITATVSITSLRSFTGTIALSVDSSGPIATLDTSTASLSPGGPLRSVTLTLKGVGSGTFDVLVHGTSGSLSHSAQLTAVLTPVATLFGLQPQVFYAIFGVVVAASAAALVALVWSRPRLPRHSGAVTT